jgi:hypothetical protein
MAWYDFIKGFFSKNPPEKNEDLEELTEMLKSMTEDLSFTSESDYPFEIILWQKITRRLDVDSFSRYLDIENPELEGIKIEKLLRAHSKIKRSSSETEREKASRFKQILEFFQSQVSYPIVIKVGKVERDVYILGIAADNYIIGLKTKAIET